MTKISVVIPSLKEDMMVSEKCSKMLREASKREIEVIIIAEDETFAKNSNAGIKKADGDIIAVVNNDITPLPGWDEGIRDNALRGIASFTPRVDCGWAFGCGRKCWEEVGLLDENLINSYEDFDFFIRAAMRGYHRIPADRYYAIHEGGRTMNRIYGELGSKRRILQATINRNYMMAKYPGLNIDAISTLYWAVHAKGILEEWEKSRGMAQEA